MRYYKRFDFCSSVLVTGTISFLCVDLVLILQGLHALSRYKFDLKSLRPLHTIKLG